MDALYSSANPVKKPKHRRASHAKTRFGCTTCKIRKLKCDETKPECLRCMRFLGTCDGYSIDKINDVYGGDGTPTSENNLNKSSLRPLLPRMGDSYPILYRLFDKSKLRNEKESLSFLAFKALSVSDSFSLLPSSLWERTILQAFHEEAFVREAVVAVGALFSCERKIGEPWSSLAATPRYQFALQHYVRAVGTMRQKLSVGGQSLRSMLIGCLLIVCFEAMQGNYVSAMTHAIGGHTVLQNSLALKGRSIATYSLKGMTTNLADYDLDEELVRAFVRMDLQVCNHGVDPRPIESHQALKSEGTEIMSNMPSKFQSLEEARKFLELVGHRTWHFIGTVELRGYQKRGGDDTVDVTSKNDSIPISQEHRGGSQGRQAEYFEREGELLRWQSSFEPLYRGIPRKSREWKAASLLKMQAQTTIILLSGYLYFEQTAFDRFLPDFQWIVSLGKEIFDEDLTQDQLRFSFDGGIIRPLWTIGTYCRDPKVRREAIAMLRKVAVRELVLDALSHVVVCEAHMRFEEEGMDKNGYIPESERFLIVGGKVDGVNRIGTVIFRKVGKKGDGTADVREFHSPF